MPLVAIAHDLLRPAVGADQEISLTHGAGLQSSQQKEYLERITNAQDWEQYRAEIKRLHHEQRAKTEGVINELGVQLNSVAKKHIDSYHLTQRGLREDHQEAGTEEISSKGTRCSFEPSSDTSLFIHGRPAVMDHIRRNPDNLINMRDTPDDLSSRRTGSLPPRTSAQQELADEQISPLKSQSWQHLMDTLRDKLVQGSLSNGSFTSSPELRTVELFFRQLHEVTHVHLAMGKTTVETALVCQDVRPAFSLNPIQKRLVIAFNDAAHAFQQRDICAAQLAINEACSLVKPLLTQIDWKTLLVFTYGLVGSLGRHTLFRQAVLSFCCQMAYMLHPNASGGQEHFLARLFRLWLLIDWVDDTVEILGRIFEDAIENAEAGGEPRHMSETLLVGGLYRQWGLTAMSVRVFGWTNEKYSTQLNLTPDTKHANLKILVQLCRAKSDWRGIYDLFHDHLDQRGALGGHFQNDPEVGFSYLNLAESCLALGNEDESVHYFKLGLINRPDINTPVMRRYWGYGYRMLELLGQTNVKSSSIAPDAQTSHGFRIAEHNYQILNDYAAKYPSLSECNASFSVRSPIQTDTTTD